MPVEITLMNEYGVDVPLWGEDGQTDGDEFDLSDELLADLRAFGRRWNAWISPEVYDDRWIDNLVMDWVVSARYAFRRLIDPAGRRAEREEYQEMLRIGEALAVRVQDELGDGYVVRYAP